MIGEILSSKLAEVAAVRPVDRERAFAYAYLVSAPHSGSTLLACLLGAHPEISSVGEFGSDWSKEELLCSCGVGYLECSFWREWMELARREGIDFDVAKPDLNLEPRPQAGFVESLFYHLFPFKLQDWLRDLLYIPGTALQSEARRRVERGVRLARLLCETQGTRVFFDSTKNAMQIRFLAGQRGLRLKVVSLIRDGRGVMCSLMKHYGTSPEAAIDNWLWSIRNQERAVAHYMKSVDVLQIRLEDLCRDPELQMRRLFEFLDVSPAAQLDYSDTSTRHVTGNTMRLKFDGVIRADESWRTKLTSTQLQLFASRAGRINRRYGYAD